MAEPDTRRDEILQAFEALRKARRAQAQQVAPRRAAARKDADQEVVDAASAYTLEHIVKGLAEVQLTFDGSVETLTDTLTREATKLRDIRRAIDVEARRIDTLRNIKIAADALDILEQEHEQALAALEAEQAAQRAALEDEITETRATWAAEQAAFEQTVQEEDARRQREREQTEEEYQYATQRQRQKERDAYEEKKREVERRLREEEAEKAADWAVREAALEARQGEAERHRAQIAAFEQEKQEAVQAAREEAAARAREEAETEAALFEREVAAKRNSYEVKIQLLEQDVARQSKQIDQLTEQLQGALEQTQQLAARAMGSGTAG